MGGGQWQRTQSLATFINHLSINFSLFRSYSELTRKDLEWSIFKLKSFNTNRVDLKTFTKIVSLKEPLVVAQLLPNPEISGSNSAIGKLDLLSIQVKKLKFFQLFSCVRFLYD